MKQKNIKIKFNVMAPPKTLLQLHQSCLIHIIPISYLISRYGKDGFDLMMLVDFEESMEKPIFENCEGYSSRHPNGPFLISANDIRENINVSHLVSAYIGVNIHHYISVQLQRHRKS